MNQYEDLQGEKLGQALKTLEPIPPVSEGQWQRNRELLRTRRRSRPSSVQLAACIAGLVILLIAATFLIARPGHRSDGPAVPLPDGGQQVNPACLSVSSSERVTAAASTTTDSVELQFASHDTFPVLCAYGNGRIGTVMPQSDPSSAVGLLPFGTDSVWLIALPPTGTASIAIETPSGSSSTGREGAKDFQKVDATTVVALPIEGRPVWVRTTFLDSGGKVLRLSKTQLGGTATTTAVRQAAQLEAAALSS